MLGVDDLTGRKFIVIGAGWSGLAAAVEMTRRGHHVTVFEMAPQAGGRAKQIVSRGFSLDNGQHIMIGAYSKVLELMSHVGVNTAQALLRIPLQLKYPDGSGLQFMPGHPTSSFLRAVWDQKTWTRRERWSFIQTAGRWWIKNFQCSADLTVAELIDKLPAVIRSDVLEPLCIAAMNTPASHASASVFLRLLRDALFSAAGSSDLLLPRWPLSKLLPEPAIDWLVQAGASVRLSSRVASIERQGASWQVDGEFADGVILACTATEAARLVAPHDPSWAKTARELTYEPIATVYAHSPGACLPEPMMALRAPLDSPAQFVFDLGRMGGQQGLIAFVISGASDWSKKGNAALMATTLSCGEQVLGKYLSNPLTGVRVIVERRATFLCSPGLSRPQAQLYPGLVAAGDYVAGPYPATLEGAVRSGIHAAHRLMSEHTAVQ